MTEQIYNGKTFSFYDLIKAEKIEIPIIQRDYAQGRKDKKELRQNFLNALFDCIDLKKPIKLDFIYGSSANHVFQPLDGQQRLTTLFLLYWYAATKDSELNSENINLLSRFSYETRITSREFCKALINNIVAFDTLETTLSDKIIDSNWFFLSWKKDPTIEAMLRTIDDIHSIFNQVNNLWLTLTASSNLISFYYVELENIGLTDDLYIKMNARGKLLTSFENFKAGFQKHIFESRWEANKSLKDGFAFKIDTAWTDYFWVNFKKENSIDDALMRFISSISMIRQAIESTSIRAEERAQIITSLQEQPNSVKPDYFTQTSFNYLIECFEIYERVFKENIDLTLSFPFHRHKSKNSILSEIVMDDNVYSTIQTNSATYTQKVLFFAQIEYLRRVQVFDKDKFQDWMRVVRNIVSRGSLDKDGNRPDIVRSPQSYEGAINLVNEIAEGCESIYQYFLNIGNLKSGFSKEQVEEEKQKAKLIIAFPHIKNLIFEVEDNLLLIGRIDFIFYCMDYDYDVVSFNEELFKKLKDVFSTYFNSESGLSNDLRRAFLTIEVDDNYEFYNYWWSYWNIIGATKRRLFDKFRELEYYMYSDFKEYFKKLVLLLLYKDLKSIATDFNPPFEFPNWKIRLIKKSELLNEEAKSNYIAITERDKSCFLLKSKRPRDTEGSIEIM